MAEYRIGVDVGGTTVKAGIVDSNNQIVARATVPTQPELGPDKAAENIALAAKNAAQNAGLPLDGFLSAGFGLPGLMAVQDGILIHGGNIGMTDYPIRAKLEDFLGIPVSIGNDADCAAIGETVAGAASQYRHVLFLTLGTGLGGSMIIDRKPLLGHGGLSGEFGHMIMHEGGEHCTCGMDGCFEAYASVTALIRQANRAIQEHPESLMSEYVRTAGPINGKAIFDCADRGDATALAVIDRYAEYVGVGTGSLVSIFRPDAVVFGGAVSVQTERLILPARKYAEKYAFASHVLALPPFLSASLGNDAGIIGAAYLEN